MAGIPRKRIGIDFDMVPVGVNVGYRVRTRELWFRDWLTNQSQVVSLGQFLTDLGITIEECERALGDYPRG